MRNKTLLKTLPLAAILATAMTALPAQDVTIDSFDGHLWTSIFGMERPGVPDYAQAVPISDAQSVVGDTALFVSFEGLSGEDGFAGVGTGALPDIPAFAEASVDVYMTSTNTNASEHPAVKLEVFGADPPAVGNGSPFVTVPLDEWTTVTWDVGQQATVEGILFVFNFQENTTTTGDFTFHFDNLRFGDVGDTDLFMDFEGAALTNVRPTGNEDFNVDFPRVSTLGFASQTENSSRFSTDGELGLSPAGPAPADGPQYLVLRWNSDADGNVGFFHTLTGTIDITGHDFIEVECYIPTGQPVPSNFVLTVVDDNVDDELGGASQVAASVLPSSTGSWETVRFPLSDLTTVAAGVIADGNAADGENISFIEISAIGAGTTGELYFDNVRLTDGPTHVGGWELYD